MTSVDRILAGESGVARWDLSGDEEFFAGHFPGDPIVPGVLIGEAMAQLSGLVLFAGASRPVAARLAQISIKILAACRPPCGIVLRSRVLRSMGALTIFEVDAEEALAGPLASGTLTLAFVEAASGREVE